MKISKQNDKLSWKQRRGSPDAIARKVIKMSDQLEKAEAFQTLHAREGAFLIPNPWDAGTARLLQHLGFEALATTSLGVANMLGQRHVTAAQTLDNLRAICDASDLPVNVDLENGFADAPDAAAKMITLAAEHGAVGGSIEDYTGSRDKPIYDFNLAVERVEASIAAARALPFPFLFTARAEGMLHGDTELDDVIKRLQAFEAAGADVLYAPGLMSLADIRTVVRSVSRPFNVVMGLSDPSITLPELAAAGVKRVSIGGALSRLALKAFMDGAKEMQEGRFEFVRDIGSIKDVWAAFPS
jgi:2-methylisocitrate lyase-like PEP mutase family enzyme